jgi:hypothetical protein
MTEGLWLPPGPIRRAYEGENVPLVSPVGPGTASGLLAMGIAAAAGAVPARGAQFLRIDPTTGGLITSGGGGGGGGTPIAGLITLAIEASAAGPNVLIPAPGPGLRIRIYHVDYLTEATVSVRLLSGATNLTGLYAWLGQGAYAFDAPGAIAPWELGVAEAFIANLSLAVGIDGTVTYTVGA